MLNFDKIDVFAEDYLTNPNSARVTYFVPDVSATRYNT